MTSRAHDARWIREESRMATTTFNAAARKEQVREQLDTVLTAFRKTLDALSVTGCDGPQRKPGTFARGRPRIHKRNQSTRNDRRATDELKHFAAAGTEAFCRRAVRLRNLAGREGANGYRTISASRCGGRQRGDPRIFHRPQRGGLLGCPRRQRADRRNLSA